MGEGRGYVGTKGLKSFRKEPIRGGCLTGVEGFEDLFGF